MKKIVVMLVLLLFSSACAHAVSKSMREQAEKNESIAALFKDPDAFRGKTVIIGGDIIGARNTDKGTYIEVIQKPLDYRGRPKDTDFTYGRFIIFHPKYLESTIYSKGKQTTVAGEVLGKIVQPLAEIEYTYPLVNARELHLFEVRRGWPLHFSLGVGAIF